MNTEQAILLKDGRGLFENEHERSGWEFFNMRGNFDWETDPRSQYSETTNKTTED